MIRSLQANLLAGVALAASMAACATSAAAAAAPAKLVISYSEKAADFLPIWIAEDAGYFEKHGLDATLRYLPAEEGIPALLSNQVQIAAVGGSDGVSAVTQGANLKLIGALTPVYNFQFWALPKYAKPGALKGQRIGIASSTGSLYPATVLALKELGLTASDVAIVSLGSVTNVNNSLLAGSVAAAASHPPATYQFKRAGLVDIVDLTKKKIPSVSSGVWVTQTYADAHHAVVQAAMDAIVDAIKREKSDRALSETELRKYFGITDKAELDFTYNFYTKEVLAAQPMPEAVEIRSNIKDLSATNPKVKSVNVEALIDQSFVKAAESQR